MGANFKTKNEMQEPVNDSNSATHTKTSKSLFIFPNQHLPFFEWERVTSFPLWKTTRRHLFSHLVVKNSDSGCRGKKYDTQHSCWGRSIVFRETVFSCLLIIRPYTWTSKQFLMFHVSSLSEEGGNALFLPACWPLVPHEMTPRQVKICKETPLTHHTPL